MLLSSFGFVTYDSENDASKVLSLKEEELIFKENKLNIGHAFRKKNFVNNYNNNGILFSSPLQISTSLRGKRNTRKPRKGIYTSNDPNPKP